LGEDNNNNPLKRKKKNMKYAVIGTPTNGRNANKPTYFHSRGLQTEKEYALTRKSPTNRQLLAVLDYVKDVIAPDAQIVEVK
jgi:hypothetical protein